MAHFSNPVYMIRLFFVLIATLMGYWMGKGTGQSWPTDLFYAAGAFIIANFLVLVEIATGPLSSKKIFLAAIGLVIGLIVAWFVYPTIPPTIFGANVEDGRWKIQVICNLLFGYFGIILAMKHADRFNFSRPSFVMASPGETSKILDTSVIVDGRIKDLVAANFLEGNFIVPEFVLIELQKIADSADAKKRSRGRRGLELLDELKDISPRLAIYEIDYPEIKEVDQKLIALAKETGGEIVTNDYNLQKVAALQKVRVMNLNELANMLRPSVFVGETFNLQVVREGKEINQGIGYLEDGTMVVIEEGRSRINTEIEAQVTSILQTPAGRMVFARVSNEVPSRQPSGRAISDSASHRRVARERN